MLLLRFTFRQIYCALDYQGAITEFKKAFGCPDYKERVIGSPRNVKSLGRGTSQDFGYLYWTKSR